MSTQAEVSTQKKRNRLPLPLRDLNTLPDFTPLRKAEVLSILPISRAGWDAGVQSGRYPRPRYLSPHIPTWTLSVIKQLAQGSAA